MQKKQKTKNNSEQDSHVFTHILKQKSFKKYEQLKRQSRQTETNGQTEKNITELINTFW